MGREMGGNGSRRTGEDAIVLVVFDSLFCGSLVWLHGLRSSRETYLGVCLCVEGGKGGLFLRLCRSEGVAVLCMGQVYMLVWVCISV